MKRYQAYLLALLSGVLLNLAWPEIGGLTPLIFFSLVPLFLVEDWASESRTAGKNRFLLPYSYVTFFTWNLGSTWWIYYASLGGMVAAVAFNALFMAVVFQLFHLTKRRVGRKEGYLGLLFFWIAWEWWHMEWELTWPWLTLGNIFANNTKWIQWYEYTGTLGGSLWILIVNLVAFAGLKQLMQVTGRARGGVTLGLVMVLIAIPIFIGYSIYNGNEDKGDPLEVVALQPNVDPYNEKFNGIPATEQVRRMLDLASKTATPNTDYVIGPETALPRKINEEAMAASDEYKMIRNFLDGHPNVNFLIGMTSYLVYPGKERPTGTARQDVNGTWFDVSNTAFHIDANRKQEFYYKSKLVPGVERMPYPEFFGFLNALAIDLGGTVGSVGTQEEREVFASSDGAIQCAPVICYESIFGDYVADYVRKGANVIFIITNDGWWEDTPGYKQHLAYARLRAIETRRSIARSANTGTSCFINQRGDISQATEWWKPAVIKGRILANPEITFYVRYGEYLARTSVLVTLLLLLLTLVRSVQYRASRKTASKSKA